MNTKAIALSLLLVAILPACENKSGASSVLGQIPESTVPVPEKAQSNSNAAAVLRQIPDDNRSVKE